MKLHRYVDHQRLHIVTKDVISLSISVLLLFRHYISHKITFGAPSSGGVLRSACGAFIYLFNFIPPSLPTLNLKKNPINQLIKKFWPKCKKKNLFCFKLVYKKEKFYSIFLNEYDIYYIVGSEKYFICGFTTHEIHFFHFTR